MSIFDGKRLTNDTFKLDIERMRCGWYSDKYFENIGHTLTELARRALHDRRPCVYFRGSQGVESGTSARPAGKGE